jgi:hypothetical protein
MIKYNETVIQYKYKILKIIGILIQYCIDKRYLQVKTYYHHNIHLMSKRSLYITICNQLHPIIE